MTKQIVHFFELPELYKILLELKGILSFDINNYQSKKELSNAITDNKLDFSNSIIVAALWVVVKRATRFLSQTSQISFGALSLSAIIIAGGLAEKSSVVK